MSYMVNYGISGTSRGNTQQNNPSGAAANSIKEHIMRSNYFVQKWLDDNREFFSHSENTYKLVHKPESNCYEIHPVTVYKPSSTQHLKVYNKRPCEYFNHSEGPAASWPSVNYNVRQSPFVFSRTVVRRSYY